MSEEEFIIREIDPDEFKGKVSDPMGAKMLLELSYQIIGQVAKQGWDQPSQLLTVRQLGRETLEQGVEAAMLEVTPIPGFHHLVQRIVANGGRPHHAVIAAAYAWQELAIKHPALARAQSDVVAVGLVHEGWALYADPADPGAEQRVREMALKRQIAAQPDRVEMRMASISGRNNLRVGYLQPRDGVPQHSVFEVPPGTKLDASEQARSSGDIPTAVHFFMATIENGGVVPMEWEAWDELFDVD